MSTFKKHVGRIKNTDRRCVVIYMQIPGNEDNALIVDTDALPDRYHDALMPLIDSVEGQSTPHLHTLLARRILPDTGMDMLNSLHIAGLLRPAPIDNIVMYPAPNQPCPLRTIVEFVNGQEPTPVTDADLGNRVLENQKAQSDESKKNLALNILQQAKDLQVEADRKREQAYKMYPSLRPTEPVASVGEKQEGSNEQGDLPLADSSQMPVEGAESFIVEETVIIAPTDAPVVVEVETFDVSGLPSDVATAFLEAQKALQNVTEVTEEMLSDSIQIYYEDEDVEVAHEVDTSDEAVQAFLDRAAFREDRADREKWDAMQPKKPVGRPRKDGAPAGSVAPEPVKRGRGRPRKDPNAPTKPKGRSKTKAKVKK
jgi:hypothetical protein